MKKILIEGGFLQAKDMNMQEFNKEFDIVSLLYARILPELPIKPLTKIFIAINFPDKKSEVAGPSKVSPTCIIFRSFDIKSFFKKTEKQKQKILLNFIQDSIMDACQELGWDKTPFEYTYNEIIRRDFKSNFLMWKGKLFKRKSKGVIGVDLDVTKNSATMSVKLFNFQNDLIRQIEVFRFRPDPLVMTPLIGSAKWVSEDEFVIYSKTKETQFKVNLSSGKTEVVFDSEGTPLEFLEAQLQFANAKISPKKLELIFKGKMKK